MLEKMNAKPMIAVKDIDRAKKFYADKLGLNFELEESMEEMASLHAGESDFLFYQSDFAGTNKANALAWSVGAKFDDVFKELKNKGIQFEHYDDLPDTRLEGDIHMSGDMRLIWFKDPDGNILHVNNM